MCVCTHLSTRIDSKPVALEYVTWILLIVIASYSPLPQVFAVPGHKQMSLLQALNGYPNPLTLADSADADTPPIVTTSRQSHLLSYVHSCTVTHVLVWLIVCWLW